MTDAALSTPERSALLALMTFVSAASNKEIRERFGFTIGRPVRESLAAKGLIVATTAARNAYVHELADKGWARCRAELSAWPEGRADKGYRILNGLLRCLDHYLTATELTLADFLTPAGTEGHEKPTAPAADRLPSDDRPPAAERLPSDERPPADERLRTAYVGIAPRQGAWVGLARLREALPDLSRQEFDEALLRLDLLPHVHLIAEVNQKALTSVDRAAAIHAGGDDKHLLSIRPT